MKVAAGNLYITTDDGSYGTSWYGYKVIEDLVEEGNLYKNVFHRTDDYDEILLPYNTEA